MSEGNGDGHKGFLIAASLMLLLLAAAGAGAWWAIDRVQDEMAARRARMPKIESFLPAERGLQSTPSKPPDVPQLVVVLKRRKGEAVTRVTVGNETIGEISDEKDRAATTRATIARLTKAASEARLRAGDAADDVNGEVDAAALVPTEDVIKAVDAFIAGGLKSVTFAGTPPPDSALEKILNRR